MAMKVPLSFKSKEKPIYDYLMKKGKLSPSVYIKQLIENEMEKDTTAQPEFKRPAGMRNILDI
jgi:hypothetical protein